MIAAVIVVALLAAMLLFAVVFGAAFWYFGARTEPSLPTVAPVASEDSFDLQPSTAVANDVPLVEAPTGPRSPLAVSSPDTVQWVRLEDPLGELVASADERFDAAVPPGSYTLVLKVVGRSAVRGPVVVSAAGLTLRCDGNRDGTYTCTGAESPITLAP